MGVRLYLVPAGAIFIYKKQVKGIGLFLKTESHKLSETFVLERKRTKRESGKTWIHSGLILFIGVRLDLVLRQSAKSLYYGPPRFTVCILS